MSNAMFVASPSRFLMTYRTHCLPLGLHHFPETVPLLHLLPLLLCLWLLLQRNNQGSHLYQRFQALLTKKLLHFIPLNLRSKPKYWYNWSSVAILHHLYYYRMELWESHYQVRIQMNKQHYLLLPSLLMICS